MGLLITFSASTPATVSLGPYQELRLEGETIRAGRDGEVLAVHRSHAWEVGGQRYLRADCSAPVVVHFLTQDGVASEKLGPFVHLSFIDGVCYVDRDVFAIVDRVHDDWYAMATERHWATMVISPASSG